MPWANRPYRHYHSWLVHWFPSILCPTCRGWRR